MNVDQTITEIERLERMFAVPDTRPLSISEICTVLECPVSGNPHPPYYLANDSM
jgi:hypothetical protein